jgi:hypothetical protein
MVDTTFQDKFLAFVDSAIRRERWMADRAMILFVALRALLVIASASIPALTTLSSRAWATGVGVLVAGLTGLDTQFRWGEEWRHYRSAQLALERIRRDYERRKSALEGGRTIGSITKESENFDKLYSDVEELLQIESDSFFKFRVVEARQPRKNQG